LSAFSSDDHAISWNSPNNRGRDSGLPHLTIKIVGWVEDDALPSETQTIAAVELNDVDSTLRSVYSGKILQPLTDD